MTTPSQAFAVDTSEVTLSTAVEVEATSNVQPTRSWIWAKLCYAWSCIDWFVATITGLDQPKYAWALTEYQLMMQKAERDAMLGQGDARHRNEQLCLGFLTVTGATPGYNKGEH